MTPNPMTGLVTLPEVVTGDLAGKFGEILLYNQHADFELGSNSNSNTTSPWAIACEPAIEPSCTDSPPDFETSYHAIIDRPAIAKFMAVPHYTYLVLKMPSPAGVLSLQGDLKISFDRDTEAVELAATNQVPNAMMEIYAASKKLAPSELDIPEKSDNANKPQPAEVVQVKTIDC
jgi:hypothetical protein